MSALGLVFDAVFGMVMLSFLLLAAT